MKCETMPETYVPKNLRRWSLPPHYFGARWDGWYVAPVTCNRDSDNVENSNWEYQLEYIPEGTHEIPEDQDDKCSPCEVSERHFLCGWVSWYAIHETDADSLRLADELADRLDDYPVLNEDDLSKKEEEEAQFTWSRCLNLRDRIALCAEYGVSIFAARRDEYPQEDTGGLRDRLIGC